MVGLDHLKALFQPGRFYVSQRQQLIVVMLLSSAYEGLKTSQSIILILYTKSPPLACSNPAAPGNSAHLAVIGRCCSAMLRGVRSQEAFIPGTTILMEELISLVSKHWETGLCVLHS